MDVYVVIAESGEYSTHQQWIAGIYLTRDDAERFAAEHQSKADADRIAFDQWDGLYTPRYMKAYNNGHTNRGVLTDEARATIVAEIGEAPKGPEADSFSVIVAPVDKWGRYELDL